MPDAALFHSPVPAAIVPAAVDVALFVTCLVDQLFPQVAVSTVRVLRKLGCRVQFPAAQTCCGQPAWNSGHAGAARDVARALLDALEGGAWIVSPSGSCTGMVHHAFPELFSGDSALRRRAEALASRTRELSQFIVDVLGIEDVGGCFPHRVTYHPSCHGTRLLGVRDQPLRLLRRVRDLTLVPLERAEDCCGFGGTFAVKLPDISGAMVAEKSDHVLATGAEYLVGTDAGCLMNIAGHLQTRGAGIVPLHLAEVLDRATSGVAAAAQASS